MEILIHFYQELLYVKIDVSIHFKKWFTYCRDKNPFSSVIFSSIIFGCYSCTLKKQKLFSWKTNQPNIGALIFIFYIIFIYYLIYVIFFCLLRELIKFFFITDFSQCYQFYSFMPFYFMQVFIPNSWEVLLYSIEITY